MTGILFLFIHNGPVIHGPLHRRWVFDFHDRKVSGQLNTYKLFKTLHSAM
jgi:hypothetical protein